MIRICHKHLKHVVYLKVQYARLATCQITPKQIGGRISPEEPLAVVVVSYLAWLTVLLAVLLADSAWTDGDVYYPTVTS